MDSIKYPEFNNGYILKFWDKLSPESRKLIIDEFNRNLSLNDGFTNKINYYKKNDANKVIIEQNSGIHDIQPYNIREMVEDGILTSSSYKNGVHVDPPKEGNIAPYCVHFVNTPYDFAFEKLYNEFLNGSLSFPGKFVRDFQDFLHVEEFVKLRSCEYPILLIYKRKNNDIDVLNDVNLEIHEDFKKNSHYTDLDCDGNSEFTLYMNRTMAILGGINISQIDGIIIPTKAVDLWKWWTFSNSQELIDYLKVSFPNSYIADEEGTLIHIPNNAEMIENENIDVKTLSLKK